MDFATAKKHGLRDVFLYEPDSTGFAAMARLHSLSTPGSRILDSEERCVHASRWAFCGRSFGRIQAR